jgi:hypothetical protein
VNSEDTRRWITFFLYEYDCKIWLINVRIEEVRGQSIQWTKETVRGQSIQWTKEEVRGQSMQWMKEEVRGQSIQWTKEVRKRQTMVPKTFHRKRKIEQHTAH